MADNVGITPGTGATAAADDIGGVLYQRVKITTGTDGVADGDVSSDNPMPVEIPGVTSDAPLPVRLDQGPEAIISNNGSLQVDSTQVNEQSAERLNAPNFALLGDEPVQMVGLHPSYPIPIDTATPMPIAGRDATGAQRQLLTDQNGAIISSSDWTYIPIRSLIPTSQTGGVFAIIDCSGFQSIIAVIRNGTTSLSATLSFSMEQTDWRQAYGIDMSAGGQQIALSSVNNNRTFHIPVAGRYLRFVISQNVASTQVYSWDLYLSRAPISYPTFPQAAAINISQIGAVAVAATSAQLGVNAFGPTAPGAAHSTNNPVQMSGSDGTSVRRILTDTSGNTRVVGPLAAGTSLIPPTNAAFAPALMGIADLEGKVRRATGDVQGRQAVTLPDATAADDGIIDALNNVVRELKLLNAKITDLPYWLGINSVMPDDGQSFRDDPTLFNQ